MVSRNRFSSDEQALIGRIEAVGAELDSDPRGWGFFHASDEALALIKDLPDVQFLDLFEACEDGDASDDGLVHVGCMSSLVCVRLGDGISDRGLAHLRGLKSLKELRLDSAGEDVSDDGLKHLAELKGLEVLSLAYTGATDAGMAHLCGLVSLTELALDGTSITDDGLKHLHGLKALRKLSLRETGVTDQGVLALAEALPDCKVSWNRPKKQSTSASKQAKKGKSAASTGAIDAPGLRLRMTLKGGHGSEAVSHAAFSPDGMFLASTSMSRAIVWDLTTGTKLRSLKIPKRAMGTVAYTPDGRTIYAISNGGRRASLECDHGSGEGGVAFGDAVERLPGDRPGRRDAGRQWLRGPSRPVGTAERTGNWCASSGRARARRELAGAGVQPRRDDAGRIRLEHRHEHLRGIFRATDPPDEGA